ncbi:hypothetical protein PV797_03050 [Clostridiaceae bacterium M8S5]|nr:hypothetical protein PV797_03035 [Clostridiaceae bacterium M8S5]WDV46681.1 hypothetical protein PV797_03050 [Clostridiaceae bacterium M8S5]
MKYIIKFGVFLYGIPLGAVIRLFIDITKRGLSLDCSLFFSIIAGSIFGMLHGLIYGFVSWYLKEST